MAFPDTFSDTSPVSPENAPSTRLVSACPDRSSDVTSGRSPKLRFDRLARRHPPSSIRPTSGSASNARGGSDVSALLFSTTAVRLGRLWNAHVATVASGFPSSRMLSTASSPAKLSFCSALMLIPRRSSVGSAESPWNVRLSTCVSWRPFSVSEVRLLRPAKASAPRILRAVLDRFRASKLLSPSKALAPMLEMGLSLTFNTAHWLRPMKAACTGSDREQCEDGAWACKSVKATAEARTRREHGDLVVAQVYASQAGRILKGPRRHQGQKVPGQVEVLQRRQRAEDGVREGAEALANTEGAQRGQARAGERVAVELKAGRGDVLRRAADPDRGQGHRQTAQTARAQVDSKGTGREQGHRQRARAQAESKGRDGGIGIRSTHNRQHRGVGRGVEREGAGEAGQRSFAGDVEATGSRGGAVAEVAGFALAGLRGGRGRGEHGAGQCHGHAPPLARCHRCR